MSRARRAATALAAAAVLATPAAAWAHGGEGAAFAGPAGAYTVYAYDPAAADSGDSVEYRLILLDKADNPVDGATATVRATLSGGGRTVGPITAHSVANVYYYDLPDPGDRLWQVRLSVTGPLGAGAASFAMHGPTDQPAPAAVEQPAGHGDDTGVTVGAGIGIAIAIAIAGGIAWRRRSTDAPTGEGSTP